MTRHGRYPLDQYVVDLRSRRMSRHLYDLEKLMDTNYGKAALEDTSLYQAIVEHRRKFYHLGYVNYDLDYPAAI